MWHTQPSSGAPSRGYPLSAGVGDAVCGGGGGGSGVDADPPILCSSALASLVKALVAATVPGLFVDCGDNSRSRAASGV